MVNWSQRYRATGSVAPDWMGGHRKRMLEPHRAFIRERISQTSPARIHLGIASKPGLRFDPTFPLVSLGVVRQAGRLRTDIEFR